MPRKGPIPRREVLPDPIYGSRLAARFVNRLMYDGKKGAAEKIFYGALEVFAGLFGEDFKSAIENLFGSALLEIGRASCRERV